MYIREDGLINKIKKNKLCQVDKLVYLVGRETQGIIQHPQVHWLHACNQALNVISSES